MRVPVPIVVVLSLAVTGGGWWWWTRDLVFLRPPSEEKLARIRAEIASRTATENGMGKIDVKPSTARRPAPAPPRLADFVEVARDAPGKLRDLAAELEARGDLQRALLAHERIIDSTTATGDELACSLQAVRRLRAKVPQSSARPEEHARIITLNAGTGEDNASLIEPLIGQLAAEISRASSGILSIQPRLHLGPARIHGDLPPPVAVWLGDAGDSSPATLVRSIILDGDDGQEAEIAMAILEILADQLSKRSSLRIPPPAAANDAGVSFSDRVTRLAWKTIGSGLNPPDS